MTSDAMGSAGRLTPEIIDASLAVIQHVFRQVRPRMLAQAGSPARGGKADGSPVTDMDIEVERLVMAEMTRQFPDLPVFGEETGYGSDVTGDFWLIDPIDGTKSFIQNVPAYTSMAVLIHGGEAVASVIYNTFYDDMYVAQKGQGAYKNAKRLDLRKKPLPRVAFCRERLIDAANKILQPTGVVCEAGPTGAGYGFSLVADGRLAARLNFPHAPGGGHPHDYAPGALLVQEAGGVVVPVEGDTYTYKTRSFVACHPKLEPIIRRHARQLRTLELQTAA